MPKLPRKKEDWNIIAYPLLVFVVFIFVPLLPTSQILIYGVDKVWLILSIGWAVSWYIGIFAWVDEEKQKK